MVTEDTGTQGRGNIELELGSAWNRQGTRDAATLQPQLSYGASPTLDLILQPSFLTVSGPDGERTRGLGDTNLDAKWRFFGTAPWSLGVRAGVDLPTAQHEQGLPDDRVSPHALLAATVDLAPLTLDASFGYARMPATTRRNLYHASMAATYASSARTLFIVDVGADSNPDGARNRDPVVAVAGTVYTLKPGLDFDIGYQIPLSSAASAQWLMGITFRGAP